VKHRARGAGERGAALAAALVALAVSAALVAGLTDAVRTEVILARERRSMVAALAAADACIAQHLATVPFGWDLDALLLGPDGAGGTPDDGTIVTPPGCTGSVARAPGPASPPRKGRTSHRLLARRLPYERFPLPSPSSQRGPKPLGRGARNSSPRRAHRPPRPRLPWWGVTSWSRTRARARESSSWRVLSTFEGRWILLGS